MSIDWTNAPIWACFAAMDSDGNWYWYQEAPYMTAERWINVNGQGIKTNENIIDWKKSLVARSLNSGINIDIEALGSGKV